MNDERITFVLGVAKARYISYDEMVHIHEYKIMGS